MRPGTASKSLTGGIARPPTGGPRPSSGIRTAVGARPMSGVPGVGGMGTTQAGYGGAVIPEKNIYSVQIRQKMTEIQNEIDRLQQEMLDRQDDGAKVQQLKKDIEDQTAVIKSLHLELRDMSAVNELAEQHVHLGGLTERDVDIEISKKTDEISDLVMKNQRMRDTVDEIFTKRRKIEEQIADAEDEIERKQQEFEEIVLRLPPHEQEGYHAMMEQKERLEGERASLSQQIDATSARLRQLEEEVRGDPSVSRVVQLQQQVEEMRKRSEDLDAELGVPSAASAASDPSVAALAILPTDDKETIKRKIKESNAKIREYEEQTRKEEKAIEELRRELLMVGMEESEHESKEESEKQLAALQEKEKELDRLLASFEDAREAEQAKKQETQRTIVDLLAHISEELKRSTDILAVGQASQTKDDLDFKRGQTQNAIATRERIAREKAKAESDLAQIKTLESNIEAELKSLTQSMQTAQEELKTFSNLDALRDKYRQSQEELTLEEKRLRTRVEQMRERAKSITDEEQELAEEAKKDKQTSLLERLERRLSAYFKSVYDLQQSLIIAERQGSYAKIHDECLSIIADINSMHITTSTQSPTSITTSAAMATTAQPQPH